MDQPIGHNWRHTDPTDIIGRKFGQLLVEELASAEPYRRKDETSARHRRMQYRYRCRCDCGASVEVVRPNLLNDHTTSCGCLRRRAGNSSPTWRGHGDISARFWTQIQRHAASRRLEFNLTIEEAWEQFRRQDGRCALTGWPLSLLARKGRYGQKTASLDRIDSQRGYEPGNVQWLHKDVNRAKWDHSTAWFIEICKAVASHQRGEDAVP